MCDRLEDKPDRGFYSPEVLTMPKIKFNFRILLGRILLLGRVYFCRLIEFNLSAAATINYYASEVLPVLFNLCRL